MPSGHAKGWLTLVLYCVTIGLFSACATDEERLPWSQLGYPSATGTRPLLATRAVITAADQLQIDYRNGDDETSASIPVFAPTPVDPAHQRAAPPVVPFEPSGPTEARSADRRETVRIRSIKEQIADHL